MIVTHVTSEEGWEGLYLDKGMGTQGYAVLLTDALELISCELAACGGDILVVEHIYLDGAANRRLMSEGVLPKRLEALEAWLK